jgi:hypothetical protein
MLSPTTLQFWGLKRLMIIGCNLSRAVRLYEQEQKEPSGAHLLGFMCKNKIGSY